MEPTGGFHAVLFDFFGTLTQAVQRGPQHADIARSLGCEPDPFIALLDRTFLDRAGGRYGSAEATLRWICAQLGTAPDAARIRAAHAARVAAVRADTRLRPEALRTLRVLRQQGRRIGVVSDCGYELPAFLPTLPVAELLDTAVYSVDVRHCKPHPVPYLAACERLGVHPQECLYVGDGGSRELTGAAEVGMTAVRLAAPDLDQHLSFETERDWAGPTITSLDEVPAIAAGRHAPMPVPPAPAVR